MSQPDLNFNEKIEAVVWAMRKLSDDERQKFLDRLAAVFCRHCGVVLATRPTGRCSCVRDE